MFKQRSIDFDNVIQDFKSVLKSLNYDILFVNKKPMLDKNISIVEYIFNDSNKSQLFLKFNHNTMNIDIKSNVGFELFNKIAEHVCPKPVDYRYFINYYTNFILYLNIAKRSNLQIYLLTGHVFENSFYPSPIEQVASYDDPYSSLIFEWKGEEVANIDILSRIDYHYSNGLQIKPVLEVCYRDKFNETLENFVLDISNNKDIESFLLKSRELFKEPLMKKMATMFDLSIDSVSNMTIEDFNEHMKILEMEMIT